MQWNYSPKFQDYSKIDVHFEVRNGVHIKLTIFNLNNAKLLHTMHNTSDIAYQPKYALLRE